MKKLLLIFTATLMLTSCTVILPIATMKNSAKNKVTHKDIMSQYNTKNDVVNNFGIPTTKDNIDGKEIWHYDLGNESVSTTNISARKANLSNNVYASGATRTSSYNKYVEFHFNGDYITNWRSNGVNYGNYNERYRKALTKSLIGILIDTFIILLATGDLAAELN